MVHNSEIKKIKQYMKMLTAHHQYVLFSHIPLTEMWDKVNLISITSISLVPQPKILEGLTPVILPITLV